MVDLVDRSSFFIKAIMGFAINGVVDLSINKVISTGTNIAIGLAELFLW